MTHHLCIISSRVFNNTKTIIVFTETVDIFPSLLVESLNFSFHEYILSPEPFTSLPPTVKPSVPNTDKSCAL